MATRKKPKTDIKYFEDEVSGRRLSKGGRVTDAAPVAYKRQYENSAAGRKVRADRDAFLDKAVTKRKARTATKAPKKK